MGGSAMPNGHTRKPNTVPDARCKRCVPEVPFHILLRDIAFAKFAKLGHVEVKKRVDDGWSGFPSIEDRAYAIQWLIENPDQIAAVNAKCDDMGFKRARAMIEGNSIEDELLEEEAVIAAKWVSKHHPDRVGLPDEDEDESDSAAPDDDTAPDDDPPPHADDPPPEKEPPPEHALNLELAIKLWGKPHPYVTGSGEYFFGKNNSKRLHRVTGQWYDFEKKIGGYPRDLMKAVTEAHQQQNPNTPNANSIKATPFQWIDPAAIPQRQWLYGTAYIRKFLSVTISTGAVGKSSKLIVEALAMVTGKDLLGVGTDGVLYRVWYWNGEDPMEELQRRFAAAIKHYKLTPDDIGDRLFIDNGQQMPIVLAEQGKDGTKIATPVVEGVVATLLKNKIDVLQIDPFVSCHRVVENDNGAIDLVAKSWSGIANTANCSVMIAHHTRKPMTGGNGGGMSIDDGRGAGALINAARQKCVLNNMTKEEAKAADIDENQRRYYFRADSERS